MALPDPEPGLVVRYDFLWRREAELGRKLSKDRPACLVAASDRAVKPRYVVLLPITHTRLGGDTIGIEIPAAVRRRLGLDDEPCWVIVSEYNVDEWPNAGLAPIRGKRGVFAYGFLPPSLFAQVQTGFLKLASRRGVRRR